MNQVGVNLNQASEALLSYVSGITETVAKEITQYRDKEGAFKSRDELRKVKGFGPKSFEQAAGFQILDQSGNRLISVESVFLMSLLQVPMLIPGSI